MSSKYIERAWVKRTVSADEKLLLLALAELADREGAFYTSMSELKSMMCVSESMIDNLIGKLCFENTLVGLNKGSSTYRSGKIQGKLNISSPQEENHYVSEAYQQPRRVSQFQRAHMKSVQTEIQGKVINVRELSPNVVEAWAEGCMFRNGYSGQTNIWAAFIERIREKEADPLISQDVLISRLYAFLHQEKGLEQKVKGNYYSAPKVKRSALDDIETKISNLTFKDE